MPRLSDYPMPGHSRTMILALWEIAEFAELDVLLRLRATCRHCQYFEVLIQDHLLRMAEEFEDEARRLHAQARGRRLMTYTFADRHR